MTDAAALWDLSVRDIVEDLSAHASLGRVQEWPGAIGILDSPIPFPCYVHGVEADLALILEQLLRSRPVPKLHVVADHPDLALVEAAGWVAEQRVTQMVLTELHRVRHCPPVPGVSYERLAIPQGIPAFYAGMTAGFGEELGDAEEELPREVIVTQGIWLFVARDGQGQVIGTAGARRRGQGANLFAISVVPEHRGRGIGGALTALASQAMLDAGACSVQLHATEAGHGVYERTGFATAGAWLFYRPATGTPATE